MIQVTYKNENECAIEDTLEGLSFIKWPCKIQIMCIILYETLNTSELSHSRSENQWKTVNWESLLSPILSISSTVNKWEMNRAISDLGN